MVVQWWYSGGTVASRCFWHAVDGASVCEKLHVYKEHSSRRYGGVFGFRLSLVN